MESATTFSSWNTTNFFTTDGLGKEVDITKQESVVSTTTNIIITVVIVFFLVFSSVGNILTLIVIAKTKSLHIPSNYFIVSLCISDLISAILCSPLWLHRRTWGFVNWDWGTEACQLYWIADFTTNYATAFHILSFAIVRFVAVKRPFVVHSFTSKRIFPFIILIWVVSLCLALPLLWLVDVNNYRGMDIIGKDWPACSIKVKKNESCCQSQYNLYMMVAGPVFFYLPEILIIFFSVTIARALLRRRKWMQGFANIYSISDQIQKVNSNQSSIRSNKSMQAFEKDSSSNLQSNNAERDEGAEQCGHVPKRDSVENLPEEAQYSQATPSHDFNATVTENDGVGEFQLHAKDNTDNNANEDQHMGSEADEKATTGDGQDEEHMDNQCYQKGIHNEGGTDSRNSLPDKESFPDKQTEKDQETTEGKGESALFSQNGSSSSEERCGHVNLAFEDDEDFLQSPRVTKINSTPVQTEKQNRVHARSSFLYQNRRGSAITLDDSDEEQSAVNSFPSRNSSSSSLDRASEHSFQSIIEASSNETCNDFNSIKNSNFFNQGLEQDKPSNFPAEHSESGGYENQRKKETVSITHSSPSFRNYGTNKTTSSEKSLNSQDENSPATADETKATNDNTLDISCGALPKDFSIGNMKIRSASFYNMKKDAPDDNPFPTSDSVPMRRPTFKSRNASFHHTIYEESHNREDSGQQEHVGELVNVNEHVGGHVNAASRRTHQRMASENYPNPVLYNRKMSIISYTGEERRTNSFYRDRGRRATATSEKSILGGFSRRASNASIALERQYQQERSTFTQLCLVNISYMVGYIPITSYLIWTSDVISDDREPIVDYWFGVAAYFCLRFSECMNPVIYNFSSGNIRNATKKFLKKLFKRDSSSSS